jgi:hypothetical protein
MVMGASKLEKRSSMSSSSPLKALITRIIAQATNATTLIEMSDMAFIMFRDFFANKYRLAMKRESFTA